MRFFVLTIIRLTKRISDFQAPVVARKNRYEKEYQNKNGCFDLKIQEIVDCAYIAEYSYVFFQKSYPWF